MLFWIGAVQNMNILTALNLEIWVRLVAFAGILPAALVLLVGWVVAGFRNPN